jgi:hypothetical protein
VTVIADVHWSAIRGRGPSKQSLSLLATVAMFNGQLATGGQNGGGLLGGPLRLAGRCAPMNRLVSVVGWR